MQVLPLIAQGGMDRRDREHEALEIAIQNDQFRQRNQQPEVERACARRLEQLVLCGKVDQRRIKREDDSGRTPSIRALNCMKVLSPSISRSGRTVRPPIWEIASLSNGKSAIAPPAISFGPQHLFQSGISVHVRETGQSG